MLSARRRHAPYRAVDINPDAEQRRRVVPTLINAFEVALGVDDDFVAGWTRARDFLNEHAGEIPTALHRSLAPEAKFRYVNIAQVDGVEAWQAAISSPEFPGGAIPGRPHPSLYEVVAEDPVISNPGAILINVFEVPVDEDNSFVTAWEKARVALRNADGYLGTRLHRALRPDAEFRFVNVAHWASPAAFMTALRQPAFQAAAKGMSVRSHPGLYEVVSH